MLTHFTADARETIAVDIMNGPQCIVQRSESKRDRVQSSSEILLGCSPPDEAIRL